MSVVSNNILAGASGQGGAGGYEIERSLRFNSGDSSFLSRNLSSAGNRKTWTWSGWVKRADFGGAKRGLFSIQSTNSMFRFNNDDGGDNFRVKDDGSGGYDIITKSKFRDVSAWYHFLVALDTTQSTAADRVKIYVNGVRETVFFSASYPTQNQDLTFNSAAQHSIGRSGSSNNEYHNGYLADVHFIDGQALAPTDFGETDDNGVWQPKKGSFSSLNNGTVWSNNSTGTFDSTYPKINAFDGNLSTVTYSNNSDDARFNFSNITITQTNRLRVYGASGWNNLHSIFSNGSSQTWNNQTTQWHDLTDLFTTPWSFDQYKTTNNGNLNAIEIGGEILIDNYNNSTGYGTNGFHLPFSDNSSNAALGTDTSGNSNTWTVNNLSANEVDYAATGTVSSATGATTGPVSRIFDGDLNPNNASYFSVQSSGSHTGTITFSPKLPAGTTIELFGWKGTSASSGVVEVNGTDVSSAISPQYNSPPTWGNVSSAASGGIETIKLYRQDGVQTPAIAGVRVDGVVLVSGTPSNTASLRDTPTNGTASSGGDPGGSIVGNYATLNPLAGGAPTNGNLHQPNNSAINYATIGVSSGKWYFETTINTQTAGGIKIGVAQAFNTGEIGGSSTGWAILGQSNTDGGKGVHAGALTSSYTTYAQGDIVNCAFDMDSGKIYWGKNGTWLNSGNPATGAGAIYSNVSGTVFPAATANQGGALSWNFGQRAFNTAAPSGYKALCTANLPEPTIADGSKYFDTKLWTGNGTSQTITTDFLPGLIWVKERSNTSGHQISNIISGAGKRLSSNLADAEYSNSQMVTAFNSDGFGIGSHGGHNENNQTYVGWAWDAGTSTVSNTDGSITSQVRANPTAGFSIVKYIGNNTTGATVGHGLSSPPQYIIVKRLDASENWCVYSYANGNDAALFLNTTASRDAHSSYWNDTDPNSSVFTLGSSGNVSHPGDDYIAYCFSPVEGYSAMGSFSGDDADPGPFVYLGFKPKLIILKNRSATREWVIYDTSRSPFNEAYQHFHLNDNSAENTAENDNSLDILSNGFRLMGASTSNDATNGPGNTIIYIAFAENPFKNARAR